jgi:hypothetical protein
MLLSMILIAELKCVVEEEAKALAKVRLVFRTTWANMNYFIIIIILIPTTLHNHNECLLK